MKIIGRALFVFLTWPAVAFVDVPNMGWGKFWAGALEFIKNGDPGETEDIDVT